MSPASTLARLALPVLLLALPLGCAGLMMTVEDQGGDAQIMLHRGDQVAVAKPTVDADLNEAVAKSFGSVEAFVSQMQTSMVAALAAQGVVAKAGSEAPGGVLELHVSAFSAGSGAARMFLGGGFGDSDLGGSAVLRTPAGRRELEITKTGSQSGTTEAGDQSHENMGYFTTALAQSLMPDEG